MRAERSATPWRWPLAALIAGAAAWMALSWQPAWSASAWSWIDLLGGGGEAPPHATLGRGLRSIARAGGLRPAGVLFGVQLLVASATLLGVFGLGAAAAGRGRGASLVGLAAAGLALLWPVSRQALVAVSAESVLACASTLLACGCLGLVRRPRLAAVTVGGALLVLVLAHPIGLPAAGLMILVAAFYPQPARPPGAARGGAADPLPATVPAQGVPSRAIWTAWIAALLLCAVGLRAALPDAGLERLWSAAIGAIREPRPASQAGGLSALPLIGPTLGWLARTPPALFLLGAATAAHALGPGRRTALSAAGATAGCWWLLATAFGRSLPGAIDPLVIASPLLCVLAAAGAGSWARHIWLAGHPARLAVIGALLGAALLSVAADGVVLDPGEPQTALGRALGLIDDAEAGRPALLIPDDLAVIREQPGRLAVQPSRRGGARLARALTRLGLLKTTATFTRAFGAEVMLTRGPVTDPLGRALAGGRPAQACTPAGRSCLYDLGAP